MVKKRSKRGEKKIEKILIISEDKKSFRLYLDEILKNKFKLSKVNNNRPNNNKFTTKNNQIIIENRFTGYTDPKSIVEESKKEIKEYNKIYCVYDYKKNQKDSSYKIASKDNIDKDIKRIKSCPSYEFWLFLHFSDKVPIFKDNEDLIKRLKKFIPDYKKNNFTDDLFDKLDKNLITATKRARDIDDELDDQDKIPNKTNTQPDSFTEIYKLIEDFEDKFN
jgi:hypothetical protein